MEDLFDKRRRGLKTVDRIYAPRVAGLFLGSLPIANVYLETRAPAFLWTLLLAYALGWPHLAKWAASRSSDPYKAELRSMLVDALALGWILSTIGFKLLPAVLLLTMMSMGQLGVAGVRLLARALPLYVTGAMAGQLVIGGAPSFESSGRTVIACLPMLTLYPLMIGAITYLQAKKLVAKQRELTQALSEIKSLRGLLPICSHCKSIRDDQGSWKRMEEYITERSDARFSHSVCPNCLQEHYPEYTGEEKQ